MNENARTALLVDGAAIATLWVSYATRASAYGGPELCVVRRLLKVRCAGCGLMRAFASLWEGSVAEAFRMHALGPPLFAALILAPTIDLVGVALGRGPVVPRLLGLRPFQVAVAAGVALTLALPVQDTR